MVTAFSGAITYDPVFRWFVTPIIAVLTIYYLLQFGTNVFYKQFDLKSHFSLTLAYWTDQREGTVDVFLPICDEESSVLKRTWEHVSRLKYKNKCVYVLDDSKENTNEHKRLAEQYGFFYLERPNKGKVKKAGNLKYGFERSSGEFILVLDADFAPHPDFLKEIVPYMIRSDIAIVQTPQYFFTPSFAKTIHKRSPLEYGAAYTQEDFYRVGQVARNRIDGALCCGTNALYRRSALASIGGPLQVDKSEDSRTGYALLSKGWRIEYLPIILAAGICPNNAYSYFHQQHRWASGRAELTLSSAFWLAPVRFTQKLCYFTGFLFYLEHLFVILLSLHFFYMLFIYNDHVSFVNILPYIPFLIFWYVFLPLFRTLPLRPGSFLAGMAQIYSHGHALLTVCTGRSIGWISTNAKHKLISRAFRQTMFVMATYLLVYVLFIALAVRTGTWHLFDYDYYSVQFWILYNFILSGFLLWYFYKTMDQMQRTQISSMALILWRAKTAGAYVVLTVGLFATILII
ncbi:glycosyltransferase [Candidatus Kaiserbacteria bacterium]|nr:glycosyltransferase [Candidatus Kaiserbacteria bacterium]